jgi:hypothetical protein
MKRLMIALMVLIMMAVTVTPATSQNWEFNWTLLDIADVPDLAGYRLYFVPTGDPVVIGGDRHVWQSADTNPSLPVILNVPEGAWDTAVTSFDAGGKESDPSIICTATVDDAPPTPPGYGCQPAP